MRKKCSLLATWNRPMLREHWGKVRSEIGQSNPGESQLNFKMKMQEPQEKDSPLCIIRQQELPVWFCSCVSMLCWKLAVSQRAVSSGLLFCLLILRVLDYLVWELFLSLIYGWNWQTFHSCYCPSFYTFLWISLSVL